MPFDTIDINMGCPVQKVVKVGCGSAILKDPSRVYETVKKAKAATAKPLSAKIRLGWDRQSVNAVDVACAIAEAGADWLIVHGRCRSDDYSVPVNLEQIAQIKQTVSIPVIGNGNIFSREDAEKMREVTNVDGVMVSRGALGNPWVFREIQTSQRETTLDEWLEMVLQHLEDQRTTYGLTHSAAVCMRKHLLWYAKGWQGAKELRDQINRVEKLEDAKDLFINFANKCRSQNLLIRQPVAPLDQHSRFVWDPKYEMDRELDRGVGAL